MKFLNRLLQLQELIENGNTGSPRKLSKKLYISESQLYVCLRTMKKLGVPVKFCRKKNSYFYTKPGSLIMRFSPPQEISESKY